MLKDVSGISMRLYVLIWLVIFRCICLCPYDRVVYRVVYRVPYTPKLELEESNLTPKLTALLQKGLLPGAQGNHK